jgi:hypothetical protein
MAVGEVGDGRSYNTVGVGVPLVTRLTNVSDAVDRKGLQERACTYVAVNTHCALRHVHCSLACAVQRTRVPWIRGLGLYRTTGEDPMLLDDAIGAPADGHVHARSRFRSVRHPDRFAVYAVHEPGERFVEAPGDHTLVVVREFRRVPLHASALGLVLFAARLGREAQVVATLAHFAERALSLYQPPYLLLARSLEQPGITMLLTGVQATSLLETGGATAFSVDQILPELTPLLAADPELYAYSPELEPESIFSSAVSPYAV